MSDYELSALPLHNFQIVCCGNTVLIKTFTFGQIDIKYKHFAAWKYYVWTFERWVSESDLWVQNSINEESYVDWFIFAANFLALQQKGGFQTWSHFFIL